MNEWMSSARCERNRVKQDFSRCCSISPWIINIEHYNLENILYQLYLVKTMFILSRSSKYLIAFIWKYFSKQYEILIIAKRRYWICTKTKEYRQQTILKRGNLFWRVKSEWIRPSINTNTCRNSTKPIILKLFLMNVNALKA